MNRSFDHNSDNTNQPASSAAVKQQTNSIWSSLSNHKTQSNSQDQLLKVVNQSKNVSQFRFFQNRANNSSRVKNFAQLQGIANQSSGMNGASTSNYMATMPQPETLNTSEEVIQKMGGIEYETGIAARDAPPGDNEHVGFIEQDKTIRPSNNGWQIDSDNSKLEFVTYPPVNLAALPAIMDNMLDFIDRGTFPLAVRTNMDTVFGGGTGIDPKYDILPYPKAKVTGSPQGSIGIPLRKMGQFFAILSGMSLSASLEVLKEHKKQLNERYKQSVANGTLAADTVANQAAGNKVKDEEKAGQQAVSNDVAKQFLQSRKAIEKVTADKADDPDIEGLRGIMQLVAHYISKAQTATKTSYKKQKFSVMARTSFAAMYQMLTDSMQKVFKQKVDEMIVELGVDPKKPLFPAYDAPFLISDWMESIQNPIDRHIPDKKGEYDKTVKSDLMTAPGSWDEITKMPTDISMGQLNDVPMDGLVVVELRTLKHFAEAGTFTTKAMRLLANDLRQMELLSNQ